MAKSSRLPRKLRIAKRIGLLLRAARDARADHVIEADGKASSIYEFRQWPVGRGSPIIGWNKPKSTALIVRDADGNKVFVDQEPWKAEHWEHKPKLSGLFSRT